MSILDRIDNAFNADLDCNTDKVILLAIARYADEGGFCWVSKKTLAKTTNRAECTVWRSLVRLEQAGEIVRVPMHDPAWHGVQRCNGYILTTHVKGEAGEICPTLIAAAIEALKDKRFSRQRDGEDRDSATVRIATARPLEVIQVSDPNEPTAREIRESGYAAFSSDSGEVDQQQQQPTDAAPDAQTSTTIAADTTTTDPADPPAQHDAVTYAWIDVFGELSDPRTVKFISNAVRGNSADEVLRALALAKGQLEKGKEIAAPAAYVKKILASRMNEIGAGHRTAKQPPAAGHRNPVDWSAVAIETAAPFDQAALDAEMERTAAEREAKRQEREADQERRAAEAAEWQRGRDERERIRRDNEQMERERQRLANAAERANRERQDIAKRIAAAIEAPDQAGRMADDFLRVTRDEYRRNMGLDMLTMKRHQAGKPLTTAEATAILHGGLNTAAPARAMA